MKKLVFLSALLLFSVCQITAQKLRIKEYYYSVNADGEVDRKKVIEKRQLIYDKKRGLISVENLSGFNRNIGGDLQSDLYYNLPQIKSGDNNYKFDDKNRIVEHIEKIDGGVFIKHNYKYNNWGDLVEDKCTTVDNSGKTLSESTLSYEYVYLDDFTYAKKDNKDYISGTKHNYDSTWVLRTIKKNGVIVQYTERKISNPII